MFELDLKAFTLYYWNFASRKLFNRFICLQK